MKILYCYDSNKYDYLGMMIYHGLVSLYGDDVIDDNYLWFMSNCELSNSYDLSSLYGRGFTYTKILNDRTNIDRENIEDKINQHYFDIIVYGRVWEYLPYYDLVCEKYNSNEIIYLDGEDDVNINFNVKKGIYFKRELSNNIYVKNIHNLKILPISFCIPKSKFMEINFKKTNAIVGLSNEYVFTNELDYYTNYNNAYFGSTKKKNGWDCLRHYEIIAAGCLPFFFRL